jgi:hypothetical protein
VRKREPNQPQPRLSALIRARIRSVSCCTRTERGFLDHNGVLTDFKLSDGTPAVSSFKTPSTLCLLKLFKIRDGKISRVETVYINVSYHMPGVW